MVNFTPVIFFFTNYIAKISQSHIFYCYEQKPPQLKKKMPQNLERKIATEYLNHFSLFFFKNKTYALNYKVWGHKIQLSSNQYHTINKCQY